MEVEVEVGLKQALPKLRKTISRKLSLAVAAMIEVRTANTAMIANAVPLETELAGSRQQWLRRLLKNELLDCTAMMKPFAMALLKEAAARGKVVMLSLDQTDIGKQFAMLMISVRVGDRALPFVVCRGRGSEYWLCGTADAVGASVGLVARRRDCLRAG